jgi:hypothetical protein
MRRLRILAHALVTIPIVVASSSATRLAAQDPTPPVAKTIKINMAGGHSGSSGRYDALREEAFRYAFMLDAVGLGDRLAP